MAFGACVPECTCRISLDRRTPTSWNAHLNAASQNLPFPFGIFVFVPGTRTLVSKVALLHSASVPMTSIREFFFVCTAATTLACGPAITFFMSERELPAVTEKDVRGAPSALDT